MPRVDSSMASKGLILALDYPLKVRFSKSIFNRHLLSVVEQK